MSLKLKTSDGYLGALERVQAAWQALTSGVATTPEDSQRLWTDWADSENQVATEALRSCARCDKYHGHPDCDSSCEIARVLTERDTQFL
jgi:hypothetical protein